MMVLFQQNAPMLLLNVSLPSEYYIRFVHIARPSSLISFHLYFHHSKRKNIVISFPVIRFALGGKKLWMKFAQHNWTNFELWLLLLTTSKKSSDTNWKYLSYHKSKSLIKLGCFCTIGLGHNFVKLNKHAQLFIE